MEIKNGHNNIKWVCIFEALGTSNLILALNLSASLPALQSFAVGLALFGNICIFGNVTGGHFNPAVTTGVFISEGNFSKNWPYFVVIVAS